RSRYCRCLVRARELPPRTRTSRALTMTRRERGPRPSAAKAAATAPRPALAVRRAPGGRTPRPLPLRTGPIATATRARNPRSRLPPRRGGRTRTSKVSSSRWAIAILRSRVDGTRASERACAFTSFHYAPVTRHVLSHFLCRQDLRTGHVPDRLSCLADSGGKDNRPPPLFALTAVSVCANGARFGCQATCRLQCLWPGGSCVAPCSTHRSAHARVREDRNGASVPSVLSKRRWID